EQCVVTVAAVEAIGAQVTDQLIVAVISREVVIAQPAQDDVVARAAGGGVVAADDVEVEEGEIADDGVVFGPDAGAGRRTGGVAEEGFGGGVEAAGDAGVVAGDYVVACAAVDQIRAIGPIGDERDGEVRASAHDVVFAIAAGEHVIAGVAFHVVVAGVAGCSIVGRAGEDGVI